MREWIGRQTGGVVVKVRRLPGASTSAVHAVALSNGQDLVLRRYVWRWVLEDEPIAPPNASWTRRTTRRPQGYFARGRWRRTSPGRDIADGIPAVLMTKLPGPRWRSPIFAVSLRPRPLSTP